jgi:hypothetical protein
VTHVTQTRHTRLPRLKASPTRAERLFGSCERASRLDTYIRGVTITTHEEITYTWPSQVPTDLPAIRDALVFIATQLAHMSDVEDSYEYGNDTILNLIDAIGVPVEEAYEAIDAYLQG